MIIDEAVKSILKIIPDDAKIIIARAQEYNNEFDSDLRLALKSGSTSITELTNEFVFQMIYSLLSHFIDIEKE